MVSLSFAKFKLCFGDLQRHLYFFYLSYYCFNCSCGDQLKNYQVIFRQHDSLRSTHVFQCSITQTTHHQLDFIDLIFLQEWVQFR